MPQEPSIGQGAAEAVGAGERTVRSGDCVFSIAAETGHHWETIWNHPENAELKAKRGSPHVLLPGDRVHVPAPEPKRASCATGGRHAFTKKGGSLDFELALQEDGEPLAGEPYVLEIEGRSETGTTPRDGVVRTKIRPTDRSGTITVGEGAGAATHELAFGALDPASTESGAAARLSHLGFCSAGVRGDALASALRAFQTQHDIEATGELEARTAQALAEAHGS